MAAPPPLSKQQRWCLPISPDTPPCPTALCHHNGLPLRVCVCFINFVYPATRSPGMVLYIIPPRIPSGVRVFIIYKYPAPCSPKGRGNSGDFYMLVPKLDAPREALWCPAVTVGLPIIPRVGVALVCRWNAMVSVKTSEFTKSRWQRDKNQASRHRVSPLLEDFPGRSSIAGVCSQPHCPASCGSPHSPSPPPPPSSFSWGDRITIPSTLVSFRKVRTTVIALSPWKSSLIEGARRCFYLRAFPTLLHTALLCGARALHLKNVA